MRARAGRRGSALDPICDDHVPSDGKQLDTVAAGDRSPDPARRHHHQEDGDAPEQHQVPGAEGGEIVLQQVEDEDPDDRRVRRVAITARGKDLVDTLLVVRQAGMEAFAASLTAAQRRKIDVAIEALMDREDIAEAYARLKEVGSP